MAGNLKRYSNADRSGDAVRFEQHKREAVDLSAFEALDRGRKLK